MQQINTFNKSLADSKRQENFLMKAKLSIGIDYLLS